jgi:hypothetical protein
MNGLINGDFVKRSANMSQQNAQGGQDGEFKPISNPQSQSQPG